MFGQENKKATFFKGKNMNKKGIVFFIFSLLFLLQMVYANETIATETLDARYRYNLLNTKAVLYKTNNSWSFSKILDYPNSYVIDYKKEKITISIKLSDFDLDNDIYAVIAKNQQGIDETLKEILETKDLNNSNFPLNKDYKIDVLFYKKRSDNISFKLDDTKSFIFNIEENASPNNFVLIFMQKSNDNIINITYMNLYILDKKEQAMYNLCEINNKIINFYCKGENCNIYLKGCLERWDFDATKFWIAPLPKVIEAKKQPDKSDIVPITSDSQIGFKIAKQAESYLGRKYKWGGRNSYEVKSLGQYKKPKGNDYSNPDFDCVGLQYVVLRDLGFLDNSFSCYQMFSNACAFADYLEKEKGHLKGIVGHIKEKSDLDKLQPGDLLSLNTKDGCFGHAGIYISIENGKHKYIHASGSRNIKGSVKYDYLEDKLAKGTLKYPFYYQRITGISSNNIDCSNNYITISGNYGGCRIYTSYCKN